MMERRDGMYFVMDRRAPPFTSGDPHLGAICHVSFSGGRVFVVSAPQVDDIPNGAVQSFDVTLRAPAFESFDDRHAIRTERGEVLLIWPTQENFDAMLDGALADISVDDYDPPTGALNDDARQKFLRTFVEV